MKLSYTDDVTNTRPEPVSGATVELIGSDASQWTYTEVSTGLYQLLSNDFKAANGIQYKLRIAPTIEKVYESEWEELPANGAPPIGTVDFQEVERDVFVYEAGERVIRPVKGIVSNIDLPQNNTGQPLYYRWKFTSTWIYIAPLSTSIVIPGYKCWITDETYLKDYTLQIDRTGSYKQDLFFLPTIRNEKIFQKFSVLISQFTMQQDHYYFWEEMKQRNEGSLLSDRPPYNLQTNFFLVGGSEKVSGYFSVVQEQAVRWYFNKKDLSYNVINTLKNDCIRMEIGPPAPECLDCREYYAGKSTEAKPFWWID